MAIWYIVMTLLLTSAAFYLSRRQAIAVARPKLSVLHSLPSYHGFYAASLVLLFMLAVLAIGLPLADRFAEHSAASKFSDVSDPLRLSALMRDVRNVIAGQHSGEIAAETQAAADAYSWSIALGERIVLGTGLLVGAVAAIFSFGRVSTRFRGTQCFRRNRERRSYCLRGGCRTYHSWNRLFRCGRDLPVLFRPKHHGQTRRI